MKKYLHFLLSTFLVLAFSLTAFSQEPNFSGSWILNFEKSKLEHRAQGLTGCRFVIKQVGDKFSLERYRMFGEKTKKISFTMVADGKTRRIKMLFQGKLEKTASGLKSTLWRKNFLNIVDYKFGTSQDEFVADEVFTGRPKDHHNIWVFDREPSK